MRSLSLYAHFLGIERGEGAGSLMMPWKEPLAGRKGFLHGGIIATFLEMACVDLVTETLDGAPFEGINLGVDFLRNGEMKATYARAEVVRMGRRIANIEAVAWQDDAAKPIAKGRMHLTLEV